MNIGRIAAIGAGGVVAVVGARKLKRSRSANSARAQTPVAAPVPASPSSPSPSSSSSPSPSPSATTEWLRPGERMSADSLDETEEIFPNFEPAPESARG